MQTNTMVNSVFTGKLMLIGLLLLVLGSCGKDDPEKVAEKDREKILKYLKEHDIDAIEHESGIFYMISREGSGGHPNISSYISIDYTGYLLNGKVFDARYGWSNYLYNTVAGWQVGIPLFKRGSSGMLFIPSGLGYGINPRSGIPANSVLIFEIELIDFSN